MSENCIICLEDIDASENPLDCGHKLHLECVKKHFKPECPICRKPLNIIVTGNRPELYLPFDPLTIQDDIYPNIVIYNYENIPLYIYDNDIEMQDAEEDAEDEENPRGDNWDYEDV